jgi:hypothetical protein
MSRRTRTVQLLALSLLVAGFLIAQSTGSDRKSEPSLFYPDREDAGFRHAKPPSNALLAVLLKTPEAKLHSDRLRAMDREQIRELFRVVQIHLATSDEIDWVVGGLFPMTSADGDWFWLVKQENGRPKVILFASGLYLALLSKRTMDFKDVRTGWSSAAGYTLTDIYHFDGTKYRLVHAFKKTDKIP